jgi:hypothetical protein
MVSTILITMAIIPSPMMEVANAQEYELNFQALSIAEFKPKTSTSQITWEYVH